MIAQERQVNLMIEMRRLLLGKDKMSPEDAFERVADRGYLSGEERKKLRRDWMRSHWVKAWKAEHPEEE